MPVKPAELACVDLLNLLQPDVVKAMHQAFVAAGARLLTSNTFCCDPDSLAGTGFEPAQVARAGAQLAREVADHQALLAEKSAPSKILVAGSLGPGWFFPSQQQVTEAQLRQSYQNWAQGLLAGGVDLLWIETVQDPLQAEAAVAGCQLAMAAAAREVPLAVLISLQAPDRLLGEQPLTQVLTRLERLPVQILGVNCSQGPTSVSLALDWLSRHSDKILACCPNAGPDAAHYLSPSAFATRMLQLQQTFPIGILGGCCGVTPDHIQLLAAQLETGSVSV